MLISFFLCVCLYRNIESSNVVRMSENPYDNNKKDTYLTLEVLAAVLENLSESGKIKVVHSIE